MDPQARTDLIVRELPDELVVYDLERHQAHCLNRTAALVFQHCDGRRSVGEIARMLGAALDAPADEELVWCSLERLEGAHLLRERPAAPAAAPRFSRREVMRRASVAATALPVVSTILAPTPAEAAASGCVAHDVTPCQNPASDGQPCDCAGGAFCDGTCAAGTCAGGAGCP